MLLAPQPIMPRQSPMFLEVPRIKRSRSRSNSRSRDSDTPCRRSRSPARSSLEGNRPALKRSSPPPKVDVSPPPSMEAVPQRKDLVLHPASQPRIRSPPPQLEPAQTIIEDFSGDAYAYPSSPVTVPTTPDTLRSRLIGAWRLESYIAYPTASSPIQRPTFPMTKAVTGLIMYTPDGYMSAQMLIPGQSPDGFKAKGGDGEAWTEAAKRCFSYAGPYYISHEGPGREEVLRHTFQVCSLPAWLGDIQVRTWTFEDDGKVLVLGSERPTEIKVRIVLFRDFV